MLAVLLVLFVCAESVAAERIDLSAYDREVSLTNGVFRSVRSSSGEIVFERDFGITGGVNLGLSRLIDLPGRQVIAISVETQLWLYDAVANTLAGPTVSVPPPGGGADAADGIVIGVRVTTSGRQLAVGTCCVPSFRLYDISRPGRMVYQGVVTRDYPFPYDYWQNSPAPTDGFVLKLDETNYDSTARLLTAAGLARPGDSGFELADISAELERQARTISATDPIWYTLPFGWSEDGLLAIVTIHDRHASPGIEPDGNHRTWAHVESVQNLITDEIQTPGRDIVVPAIRDPLEARSREAVVEVAERVVTCWRPLTDYLHERGLESVEETRLLTDPLPYGLSFDLETERDDDGAIEYYVLRASRSGIGYKRISEGFASNYHGPHTLGSEWARILDMQVAGILDSPFERRVAVIVGVRRQLVADQSTWIEFIIVGCHLDVGFAP